LADENDKPVDPALEALMGDAPAPKPGRKPKEEARLHPTLSNKDVLEAQARARSRVESDRHKAAMKAVEEEEIQRLRVEEGLTTGIGVQDEIVAVSIDLPPFAACISINGPMGKHYYHGVTYDVPRHVADTLADTMNRMRLHEDQIEGRSLSQHYSRKYDTAINARTGAVTRPTRTHFDA
jgi:hypothetical protein